MDYYICIKTYEGRDLTGKKVTIPIGSRLEVKGDFLYWESIPLCTWRSDVAKKNFVWDDNFELRVWYQNTILDGDRVRTWTERVPNYDDKGRIIGTREVIMHGPYKPEEVLYIKEHYPDLVQAGEVINYSDGFYKADIDRLESLAEYCKSIANT
jgi:hypothetical protein|nr:MAG TPA_asm: hypothetical protein [Caudoviricetes sp.]